MARRGTRKAKNGGKRRRATRKNGLRLGQRAYAPFGHVLNATGNSARELSRTTGNVVKRSLSGVRRLGNIWVKHTNMALRNVTRRK